MAIVTRRYELQTTAVNLDVAVGSGAAVVRASGGATLDIEIDDAIDGALDTLDEYMARRGFVFVQDDPSPRTSIRLVSPDGTVFQLGISNLGIPEVL